MESAPVEVPRRKNRVNSLDSNDSFNSDDSFQGEIDNFLKELKEKRMPQAPDTPLKKDIEEDNISEEKVKRELDENEKGDGKSLSPESIRIDEDKKPTSESPWSDVSSDASGPLSPEPTDQDPNNEKEQLRKETAEEENQMDSDSDRPVSRASDSWDEDEAEDYSFTEDQEKAMLELRQMKLDLQNVGYSEEDPPEYDVAERVRQLNQELANDPTPLDDERARSIKFKDDLVDLVAPPPDYPSDEEEPPSSATQNDSAGGGACSGKSTSGGNVGDLNLNQMSLNGARDGDSANQHPHRPSTGVRYSDNERTANRVGDRGGGGDGDSSRVNGTKDPTHNGIDESRAGGGEDEKVLVQRGKSFELISAKDLTAEEREIFLPPPDDDDDGLDGGPVSVSSDGGRPASHSGYSASDSSFQPTPPREPRPATANGAHRRPIVPQPKRRAQSAAPSRPTSYGVHLNSSYQSPYAQPAELKKLGERQRQQKRERERKEKEIARKEEEQKQMENDDAFQAWVKNKRSAGAWRRDAPAEDEATRTRRKEEKVHSEDGSSQDKESEAAFQEWLKIKRTQQRRERQVQQQKTQEEKEGWYDRPRQECDKAFRQYVFKEWLKKKNQDTKKAKKQEVARARINKLLVRRTRKAMQLARAIRQSQSFRYVDYYGYRY